MTSQKNKFYSIRIDVDGITSFVRLNNIPESDKRRAVSRKGLIRVPVRKKIITNPRMQMFSVVKDFDSCSEDEATLFIGLEIAQFYIKEAQKQAKEIYKKGERPRFFLKRIPVSKINNIDDLTRRSLKHLFGG